VKTVRRSPPSSCEETTVLVRRSLISFAVVVSIRSPLLHLPHHLWSNVNLQVRVIHKGLQTVGSVESVFGHIQWCIPAVGLRGADASRTLKTFLVPLMLRIHSIIFTFHIIPDFGAELVQRELQIGSFRSVFALVVVEDVVLSLQVSSPFNIPHQVLAGGVVLRFQSLSPTFDLHSRSDASAGIFHRSRFGRHFAFLVLSVSYRLFAIFSV